MNSSQIKSLGLLIANKTNWDGLEICEAFLIALTDANFHELKSKLEPIINDTFPIRKQSN